MTTAREQAKHALQDVHDLAYLLGERVSTVSLADAASDVWEPLARTLADHTQVWDGDGFYCFVCETGWPCEKWLAAKAALDE